MAKRTLSGKKKIKSASKASQKNRSRKESFLPADETYLRANPEIVLGKKIGEGTKAEIFSVAGNRNLVVKVPGRRNPSGGNFAIARELGFYDNLGLNNEPLFIPTKAVDLTDQYGCIGLVRPKLTMITDNAGQVKSRDVRNVTDAELEGLRRKLIRLTHKGFEFLDDLPLGRDKAGRLLLYDNDFIETYPPGSKTPFITNNGAWLNFLRYIGRVNRSCNYADAARKYGTINPDEHY